MGRKKIIEDEFLLEIAKGVFMEMGALGSTKEIARRAGISEAAIFKRFPTKAKLFLAAMVPPEVDTETLIDRTIDDAREQLTDFCNRLLKHFRKIIPTTMHLMTHPAISMADVSEHFGGGQDTDISKLLSDRLAELATEGKVRVSNPQASAHLLTAAVHSLVLYEMLEFHGGQNMDHAIPHFIDALWSGLDPNLVGSTPVEVGTN